MTTPVTTTTETTSTAITNDVESTITSSTGTTPIITTTTAEGTTLPQTGYSKWYQTAISSLYDRNRRCNGNWFGYTEEEKKINYNCKIRKCS